MHSNLRSNHQPTEAVHPSSWEAELMLGFARRGDKTAMISRAHRGPLTVQRPFYPEGGVCHVYLLHPPGGIVAGDRLTIKATAEAGAQALITTPAAGKFYRSGGEKAVQAVDLTVAENAGLEWLPQETIIYQGARLQSDTQIDLADGSAFFGWEITVLGRPAAGEGFEFGEAVMSWHISRGGKPFYLERLQLDAEALAARWGLQGYSTCGTMFAYPTSSKHLQAVQEAIGEDPNLGVTQIEELLICRALDSRADRLKAFFEKVWGLLREDVVGRKPCPPRIWAT